MGTVVRRNLYLSVHSAKQPGLVGRFATGGDQRRNLQIFSIHLADAPFSGIIMC
jgi:hypothetical protein